MIIELTITYVYVTSHCKTLGNVTCISLSLGGYYASCAWMLGMFTRIAICPYNRAAHTTVR